MVFWGPHCDVTSLDYLGRLVGKSVDGRALSLSSLSYRMKNKNCIYNFEKNLNKNVKPTSHFLPSGLGLMIVWERALSVSWHQPSISQSSEEGTIHQSLHYAKGWKTRDCIRRLGNESKPDIPLDRVGPKGDWSWRTDKLYSLLSSKNSIVCLLHDRHVLQMQSFPSMSFSCSKTHRDSLPSFQI